MRRYLKNILKKSLKKLKKRNSSKKNRMDVAKIKTKKYIKFGGMKAEETNPSNKKNLESNPLLYKNGHLKKMTREKGDLERVSSKTSIKCDTINIILQTPEDELLISVCSTENIRDTIAKLIQNDSRLVSQWYGNQYMKIIFGGEEILETETTFNDYGIKDEAKLLIKLITPTVQDIINDIHKLNTHLTEDDIKTFKGVTRWRKTLPGIGFIPIEEVLEVPISEIKFDNIYFGSLEILALPESFSNIRVGR